MSDPASYIVPEHGPMQADDCVMCGVACVPNTPKYTFKQRQYKFCWECVDGLQAHECSLCSDHSITPDTATLYRFKEYCVGIGVNKTLYYTYDVVCDACGFKEAWLANAETRCDDYMREYIRAKRDIQEATLRRDRCHAKYLKWQARAQR